MAIYHFSAKMISRSMGASALAAAAYRSASRLHDERLDRAHDFTNKAGVVHSEVLLPEGAPEHLSDREELWNAVEAAELRVDAQLAREIEFALPREMERGDAIALARSFVQREFVDRGMVADLNVHWDIGADGEAKPHAHVMLTTRGLDADGSFGAKVRDWNRTALLNQWREVWAELANTRLAELDIDARIDHRSLAAQGIDLEPQTKIGAAAGRMLGEALEADRAAEHLEIARRNGERLLENPALALDAITQQQATFTTRQLAAFVHRHSADKDQFDRVLAAVRAAPEIVALGRDGRGDERFTSRGMLETEQRLARATAALGSVRGHAVVEVTVELAKRSAATRGMVLSGEQAAALDHVTRGPDLGVVIGYAGTGKSAMLGVAREAWESAGYSVHGLALSGIAAENLEGGSGIASRTIASAELGWREGKGLLDARSVLVVDEAGMVGTRQMDHIVTEVEKRGAKLVLVGDPEQLQAIEAGAAFRSIAERHGSVEITDIRRQREDWQRDATRQLATGRTGEAIEAYDRAGHIHIADTRAEARVAMVERWADDRAADPAASRIMLTHLRDEVGALNGLAREHLRARGALREDVSIATTRGERDFAGGDRVMFLRNERSLGVKNGTLGTVQAVDPARMEVRLDDGRAVAFDVQHYSDIDHGYAATVHKAQGMTIDRVHVLATPGLDRHATYVALSRHRDRVDLHYGRDDFTDREQLTAKLSRERGKDMATDYAPAVEAIVAKRDLFAGLKLASAPAVDIVPARTAVDEAVIRLARAAKAITGAKAQGIEPMPHQHAERNAARVALDRVRPHGCDDLKAAATRDPKLLDAAAKGSATSLVQAMQLEAELRVDPVRRAERIGREIGDLKRAWERSDRQGDTAAMKRAADRLMGHARGLERDPQADSILRNNKALGMSIGDEIERPLSQAIPLWLGRSRSLGISM